MGGKPPLPNVFGVGVKLEVMGKVDEFLSGVKVIEEIDSPINGNIRVVKSVGFGTYIQVEGLTQSGGVMYGVWRKVLKKLSHQSLRASGHGLEALTINHCLILGLGGGDTARLIKKYWSEAKITGVEIDPIMVDLGKKYLKLDETGVDIRIEDAENFLLTTSHKSSIIKYDLILVDLYVGYDVPDKFTKENFFKLILKLLSPNGVAIFNRLYYADKKKEAEKLGEKLEKIFSKITRVYPKVNVMFVCRQNF